jgi:uncharacterized membrane protein
VSSEEAVEVKLDWLDKRMSSIEKDHKEVLARITALPALIDAKMEKRGEQGWVHIMQVLTLLVAMTAAYFSAFHSYAVPHAPAASFEYKAPTP